jgi:glycosyltransferase involved in cell wall biosynthesis
MRILHVIVGLETGGAERTLERLVLSHQAGSRFEHSVVALTTLGPVGDRLKQRGVSVHALGMRSLTSVPTAIWKLRGVVRKTNPDIVQTWMYHADLVGGIAARLAGNSRVVWGIHTTDMMKGTSRSTALVRRACAVLSYSVPSLILCVAAAARDEHIRIGYDASKMVIVPNGFDVAALARDASARTRLRGELGWSPEMLVVGCVARFNYYKDHDNFVRAAGLLARHSPNVRFLLIGRDVDARNEKLRSLITETGYADRFALLGERDDIGACLSAMDVFCLPSRSEAFPIALGEAMAAGLPSVATNVGDTAFLLGDAGIIVAKEDPVALASALARIVDMTTEERRELGTRARDRICENFSMQQIQRRLEHVYSEQGKNDAA